MTTPVQVTRDELEMILEALDDAAYYRDSRSRVLKSAVNRRNRRWSSTATSETTTANQQGAATDVHHRKALAYEALAIRLRSGR
jgi:hypothetical protein